MQLNNAKNENCLLKVKIRKLQDEIVKKNKHIEVLLNPKKVNFYKFVFYFIFVNFNYSVERLSQSDVRKWSNNCNEFFGAEFTITETARGT